MSSAFLFGLAAVASCLGIALVLPVLQRADILDVPNARSSHDVVVPRGAGIALIIAIAGSVLLAMAHSAVQTGMLQLALGVTLMAGLTGFFDDLYSLTPRSRLAAQVVIGLFVAFNVSEPWTWPWSWQGLLSVGVIVCWVSASINAFNFMDGINGISGLVAAAGGTWFWIVGTRLDGGMEVAVLGAIMAGAAIGFLPWNIPRARIFLGDSGSYTFGGLLAVMTVSVVSDGTNVLVGVAPLGIYMVDTGRTLLIRMARGESLTSPHRDHVYQIVSDRIGHVRTALLVTVSTIGVTVGTWFAVQGDPVLIQFLAALLVGVIVAGYLCLPKILDGRDVGTVP